MAKRQTAKKKQERVEIEPETTQEKRITIPAPNFEYLECKAVGFGGPMVQHRFSEKAMKILIEILTTSDAEKKLKKNKNKRKKRNLKAEALAAKHVSTEGWHGIPASAFRNAMISACKIVGYHMTKAKLSVFVEADGVSAEEGTPLVRVNGRPKMCIHYVRIKGGVVDIRARTMWPSWSAKVKVMFDADMFTAEDVTNLLARAGTQVGVMEGRPDSPNSAGMGWGRFKITSN